MAAREPAAPENSEGDPPGVQRGRVRRPAHHGAGSRDVVVVTTEAEVSDQASCFSPVQSAQIAEPAIFGHE